MRFDRSRRRDIRRSRASAFVYALIAIGAAFVKQSLAASSRRRALKLRLVPTGSPAASCRSNSRTRPDDKSSTVEPAYSARGGKVNG